MIAVLHLHNCDAARALLDGISDQAFEAGMRAGQRPSLDPVRIARAVRDGER